MSALSTTRNALAMAFAYLREKKLATALNVLLLSLGVGTIITLVLILSQAEDRLERDAAGVDLVIGAKGSPMQLILSSVFHVDVPTGNIPMGEAALIIAEPAVKKAIPLALGDSYRSFRIVGTNPAFLDLYNAKVVDGQMWTQPLQAVVGAEVAKLTGLKVGARFAGSHGLTDSGAGRAHDEHPFDVVGVMAPTGSVADRLILTSVASVWKVHDHGGDSADADKAHDHDHEGHDHGDHEHVGSKEVTAYLIQYATPLAAVSFPRLVNASSSMQAASPAQETARLFQLVGVGITALKGFAVVMILCAGLSIFIGLTNALDERRADLALLRVLGASPGMVFLTMLAQGFLLGLMGVILGLALGHGAAEWIGRGYAETHRIAIGGRIWLREEWWIMGAAVGLAVVASFIPAWRAYRGATPELLSTKG
jgi:putative ABC transport system permease protein